MGSLGRFEIVYLTYMRQFRPIQLFITSRLCLLCRVFFRAFSIPPPDTVGSIDSRPSGAWPGNDTEGHHPCCAVRGNERPPIWPRRRWAGRTDGRRSRAQIVLTRSPCSMSYVVRGGHVFGLGQQRPYTSREACRRRVAARFGYILYPASFPQPTFP